MYDDCKLVKETDLFLVVAIMMESSSNGEDVCSGCGYSIDECPHSDHVSVDCCGYKIINKDKAIPTQSAWCKDCSMNSAKPIYYVRFNGRIGIVVECTKCHSRYVLYENVYIQRYVGRHTEYGFIPPTYGKQVSLPRDVSDRMGKARAIREEQHIEEMSNLFGYTREEYLKWKGDYKQREKERMIKFRKELEAQRSQYKEDLLIEKASNKSELIKSGKIKYDKKARCFYNVETGEVVKL